MFQDDGNFDWLLPSELPLDLRAFQALIGFRRVGLLRFEASQTNPPRSGRSSSNLYFRLFPPLLVASDLIFPSLISWANYVSRSIECSEIQATAPWIMIYWPHR